MGFYVYLVGDMECVRCKQRTFAGIQTKLLRTDAENHGKDYFVGCREEIDGLDGDYQGLEPWDESSLLQVVVGDWDCAHCGLNWQWARATFEVSSKKPQIKLGSNRYDATLRALVPFRPWCVEDFNGIHYIEPDLAELSGLWGQPYDRPDGKKRWQALGLMQRKALVVAGYKQWAYEMCSRYYAINIHGRLLPSTFGTIMPAHTLPKA